MSVWLRRVAPVRWAHDRGELTPLTLLASVWVISVRRPLSLLPSARDVMHARPFPTPIFNGPV